MIKQSKFWDKFLKEMAELGYEIKHDKHIFLSIKTSKDLQEQRPLEKIIRKNCSKKEFQKTLIKRHLPLKSRTIKCQIPSRFLRNSKIWTKKEYSYARVFFIKIREALSISNQEKLWEMYGEKYGEVTIEAI